MIQPLIKTLFGDSDTATDADAMENFLFHKVVCAGSADAQNILNLINRIGSLMFILEAKENFGSKGAKEAQEVLGRVNSLFAGGELDEDAKDVFFQAIMSVYMDSKKTAREKYTPKKYRKHKDKE